MAYGREAELDMGGHEQGHAHALHVEHGPRVLPKSLAAPASVLAARGRALIGGAAGLVLSLLFLLSHEGREHFMRAYLLGWFMVFSLCGGGLVVLMLQYISGGKWGLVLRRPLEAMTNTLPMLVVLFIPLMLFGKHLYLWMAFPTEGSVRDAVTNHLLTEGEAHSLDWKRLMLSPLSVTLQMCAVFAFMWTWKALLDKWSLQRDADPRAGTLASFEYWRIRAENLSGIGILIYVILLTVVAIDFMMSMDITWLCHAEHLPDLCAVPDHLVGQPAGGDSFLSTPHPRRMVDDLLTRFHLPLGDSVHIAVEPLFQALTQQDAGAHGLYDLCPRL